VTRLSPSRTLLLGVALGLCVLAAIVTVVLHRARSAPDDYAGTPVVPAKTAADFVLTGGQGPAHVLDASRALEFLFFGYTHCPDECPLAMASLGRAYRSLTPEVRARVRVVFVTVDPERDTPAVVRRYATGFDPHFVGLTGTRARLADVWRAYGVQVDAKTKEIGHGDAIYAIDARNRVVLIYPPDTVAAGLAGDATKLAR
jgi:protein SCO1/2